VIATLKKYLPAIAGLLALIWFLVRVIPKPSRAAYPCQRAAFPIASTFVLWLVGVLAAGKLFRKATSLFRSGNVAFSALLLLSATWIAYWVGLNFYSVYLYAETADGSFVPEEPANASVGTGNGIFPGRVVWNFDPEATTWDGRSDYWWSDENTHPEIVRQMLSESLQWLTETNDDASAWEQLFRYRNRANGKGDVGYSASERIAIKLNLNQIQDAAEESNASFTSPQLVLALLQQLVEEAGVPADQITFYDAVRTVPDVIYDRCVAAYPGVRFMDLSGGPGRIPSSDDRDNPIHWSEPLTLTEVGGGGTAYIPELLSNSDYLINLAGLKGHTLAGVTFCAKNHFGSFLSKSSTEGWSSSPKSAGIHPYVAVHDSGGGASAGGRWSMDGRPMGSYNVLVDLMGHRDLGGKTILYLIDGLYAVRSQGALVDNQSRWQLAPFNDGWTSSLFLSQDPVAIDSVALDFARSEPSMSAVYGNVDNYLHEAAQAGDPPSGTVYDPEGDRIPLQSLGAHEQWNNARDKLYSRNLGKAEGIELIRDDPRIEPWWSETGLFGKISYSGPANIYYAEELGWMHVLDTETGSYIYLYGAPQLGYLYTARNYSGWIWCFGKGCWMLYLTGSEGWFYDASTGEYVKVG